MDQDPGKPPYCGKEIAPLFAVSVRIPLHSSGWTHPLPFPSLLWPILVIMAGVVQVWASKKKS